MSFFPQSPPQGLVPPSSVSLCDPSSVSFPLCLLFCVSLLCLFLYPLPLCGPLGSSLTPSISYSLSVYLCSFRSGSLLVVLCLSVCLFFLLFLWVFLVSLWFGRGFSTLGRGSGRRRGGCEWCRLDTGGQKLLLGSPDRPPVHPSVSERFLQCQGWWVRLQVLCRELLRESTVYSYRPPLSRGTRPPVPRRLRSREHDEVGQESRATRPGGCKQGCVTQGRTPSGRRRGLPIPPSVTR